MAQGTDTANHPNRQVYPERFGRPVETTARPLESTGERRAAFYANVAQQYGFRDEGAIVSTGRPR